MTTQSQPIGTNLSELVFYGSDVVFNDIMKMSDAWRWKGEKRTDGYPVEVRPGERAVAYVFRAVTGGNYPGGDYYLFHKGKGKVTLGLDATQIGANLWHIVPTERGVEVRLEESDKNDPVHRVQLIRKGQKGLYSKDFKTRNDPYQGFRFMDWGRINHSKTTSWDTRVKWDEASQTSDRGVCLGYMVRLCNEMEKDPYFCIPAHADDNYVEKFARSLDKKMDDDRIPTIENSNEVWNTGVFTQAKDYIALGSEAGIEPDKDWAGIAYGVKRSLEMQEIFERHFPRPFKWVLGSQAGFPAVSEYIMGRVQDPSKIYGISIAPYFGGHLSGADIGNLSVKEILDECHRHLVGDVKQKLEEHARIAAKYNVKMTSYEGGQHLYLHGYNPKTKEGYDQDQTLVDKTIAANRSPRMYGFYQLWKSIWFNLTDEILYHFDSCSNYGKDGCWGALEYTAQPISKAHKYRSLVS